MMQKWIVSCVLTIAGLVGPGDRASAFGLVVRPYYASAAFPCLYPPGYYTNSYYFAWYYPWYAYYNYSHGPYANWWQWGGYASYAGCNVPRPVPATVTVTLPADAKLLFNDSPAAGTGTVRTFYTTLLVPGRDYEYTLTAQVVRDGQAKVVTERVLVRGGQNTKVTLDPTPPKKKD